MRGCPNNVFNTQPHSSTIIIIVTSLTLQVMVLFIQSISDPIRFFPRSMRRRIRKIIRERNRKNRVALGTYQYFKKFSESNISI